MSLDWYFVTEVDYELESTALERPNIRYYRGFSDTVKWLQVKRTDLIISSYQLKGDGVSLLTSINCFTPVPQ